MSELRCPRQMELAAKLETKSLEEVRRDLGKRTLDRSCRACSPWELSAEREGCDRTLYTVVQLLNFGHKSELSTRSRPKRPLST